MTNTISNRTWIYSFIGLTILIIGTEYFVVHSPKFILHENLISLAITIDLTIVIPLLYYFLIPRKLNISSITVLIVFFFCTLIATILLPAQDNKYLDEIKYLLIFTELATTLYTIIKLRKIIKEYKFHSQKQPDFVYNLTIAMEKVMGNFKIWSIVIGEINTIRYGLFFWLVKKEIKDGQKFFTSHKNSGYAAIWAIIFFVILIETTGMHLLIRNWSPGLAVVITILSAYGIIFFISDLASIIKRPIVFHNNKLFFRIGIRWNAIIKREIIQSVESIRNFDKHKNKDILNCALVSDPNIKITLTMPIAFKSFYGIKKSSDKFVFNIDDKKEFIDELKLLQSNFVSK